MTLTHSFGVEHAMRYGMEMAVLIHHFQFWIEQNRKLKRNFHDGRTWMYQTQREIAAVLPYLNEDKVNRLIKKMVDLKIIRAGNYNKTPFDQTLWYSFENEEMYTIPQFCGMDPAREKTPIPQICGMRFRKSAEPIPDTRTDIEQIQQQHIDKSASDPPPTIPISVVVSNEKKVSKGKEHKRDTKAKGERVLKVHKCLEDVDIPIPVKKDLTIRYSEEIVSKAVALSKNPPVPIKTSVAQYIRWICRDNPYPGDSGDSEEVLIEKNKKYAKLFDEKKNDIGNVQAFEKYVEIAPNGGNAQVHSFKYTEKNFRESFNRVLRKYRFLDGPSKHNDSD